MNLRGEVDLFNLSRTLTVLNMLLLDLSLSSITFLGVVAEIYGFVGFPAFSMLPEFPTKSRMFNMDTLTTWPVNFLRLKKRSYSSSGSISAAAGQCSAT